MAKKDKGKKKSKSKSKQESAVSESPEHDLAPPASTAPLPTTKGIGSKPSTPSGPFSSSMSTRVPRGLQSSPSYIAQQSLKRKREAEADKHFPSFNPATGGLNGLDNILKNVNSRVKFDEGQEDGEKKGDVKDEDNSSDEEPEGLKLNDESAENEATTIEEFVTGVQEAAQEEEQDLDDEGKDSDFTSSSGSSSTSSGSSSSSSSEESEADDAQQSANEHVESDSETEAESEESESPSKRLKRKHPSVSGDDATEDTPFTSVATRNPPPPELAGHFKTTTSETSVATRNPPPPELEGQFKFSNSTVGQNIYRYPKVVLDTLMELESIIPKTVITHIEETPNENSKAFVKKHGDGNEDTKRMLVVLEGAKHVIAHLGRVRAGADANVTDEGMKEELMKKELMRIARERGQEVEVLRGQVKTLREEVVALEEKGKQKRKSSS